MAFTTYILLRTILRGLEKSFHPEKLGLDASFAFSIIMFEFVAIKLGCYLLGIQGEGQVLDLMAYGGYKFVGYVFVSADE